MFKLIRLAIFSALAFFAGVMIERFQMSESCVGAGGAVRGGLCRGLRP